MSDAAIMRDAGQAADLPKLRRVGAAGVTITYREAGKAGDPALLLLHGVGSSSASWAAQFAKLPAQGLRVIAWDVPGYGGSDTLPGDSPRTRDYAAALARLVEALRLKSFTLLGHSLGALVAASFCRGETRDKVARLILAAPASGYAKADAAQRAARVDARLSDMVRLGPAGIAETRAAALLSPNASLDAIARVRAVMQGLRPEGYTQAVRMLGRADILADAKDIATPTLVLCGGADTVTPEAGCRAIAAAIPGARCEILAGLGHALYVEDPASFDAAVLRFIAGVAP
jgi:pimeloyl-ACP methyl ester carboxylesterase